MLKVSPVTNVKNTINQISFKSGVKINAGANVVNTTNPKKEGSFVTDFLGTIKQSPLFYETFMKRQSSIEKNLEMEQNKINTIV